MTPETLNKVIKLVKIHMKSAGDTADYWEKVDFIDSNDVRRFRSIALAEYMAYMHVLDWLQDEKAVDESLEIWER